MAKIELEGMQELLDNLQQLGQKASRVENKALTKAAEPILADAVQNAPEKTGRGKRGLTISRPRKKGEEKYVLVGLDRGDISEIFYMKFHEFGTSKMKARPFLGPAYEKHKQKAVEIIRDELRRGLGL